MEVDSDSGTLQRMLCDLRTEKLFCDAVLRLEDGGVFPVHRAIIYTRSGYFRTLFTTTLHSKERPDFLLSGVNSESMNLILDYCYFRKVDINQENACQLLVSADYLIMPGLVELCCDYLKSMLVPENSIGIMRLARDHFCPSLAEAARCFVMRNFVQISQQSDELLELPPEELQAIISSDELNVRTEEFVWEVVLRWINHDTENRKHHILKLMKGVRLRLLDTQFFLENVNDHPYVAEIEECRPIVMDTVHFLLNLKMGNYKDMEIPTHEFARPRIPHDILFAIGGRLMAHNAIETYNPRTDRWAEINDFELPRIHHGTAVIGFNIYVIGGTDEVCCSNSCCCFNATSKTWSNLSHMHEFRSFVSTAVLGGLVYAMGGSDSFDRHNTAERYDPLEDQWTMIAPMIMRRSDASATTLNGKIYIAGGFNGQELLNSAEVYNPEFNQWTLIPKMNYRRGGLSCIAYHGHVYAIGGFNGTYLMRSCEKYNPTTETWTKVADMHQERSNFGTEVIDDVIFVVGGFVDFTGIRNVEYYDGKSNEWFQVRDMNMCRSGLSVCAIMDLPNIRDYTRID